MFASGHVRPITNNWLGNLIKPFDDLSVAMVFGRQRGTNANRLSEIRDLHSDFGPTSTVLVDEPRGNNGNAAIRRELWLRQPFDENLPGLEDIDWARKAERNGHRVYYAADAGVHHVHEESLKQVYRRYFREAAAYKLMFPSSTFTRSDVVRLIPAFVVRDVLFAFREGWQAKLLQVPGTRIAQYLGIYKGIRHQSKLGRNLVRGLKIPDFYHPVGVEHPGHNWPQTLAMPVLQDGQVLVQVAYANVCSADMAASQGIPGQSPVKGSCYPLAPGFDFSGIVLKTSGRAGQLRKGQKVAGVGQKWVEPSRYGKR